MAVPMRADVRRQDRPGHVGETAREERRGQFDDVVLRFEPGHEVRVLFAADFAKADKGVHLVLVAAHGLCHRGDLGHVGVERDVEQVVIAAQSPQQAVEQGEARRIAMQDRDFGELDEFSGHIEAAVGFFKRRVRLGVEQLRLVAAHRPRHFARGNAVQRERSGGFAPAVEIRFAIECYDVD